MKFSIWSADRFGEDVQAVLEGIPGALRSAHDSAAAAQDVSGTRRRDPYGHTLKNTQHERLVGALGQLPGTERLKVKGASFELIRFPRSRVVLYPWRFATSSKEPRIQAKMRLSGFRADLLGNGPRPGQLDLDQAHLSEEELDTQMADDAAVEEVLRDLSQVVLIPYASSPRGLFSVGVGQAELLNGQGEMRWLHWEPLAVPQAGDQLSLGQGEDAVAGDHPVSPDLRVAGNPRPEDTESVEPGSFASSPLDDDLGIRARPRHEDAPTGETEPNSPATGTGNDDPDDT